jgi:hypothetical protein
VRVLVVAALASLVTACTSASDGARAPETTADEVIVRADLRAPTGATDEPDKRETTKRCPALTLNELPDGSPAGRPVTAAYHHTFVTRWGHGAQRVVLRRGALQHERLQEFLSGRRVRGADDVLRWVIAVSDPPLGQVQYRFTLQGCRYVLWTASGLSWSAAIDYGHRLQQTVATTVGADEPAPRCAEEPRPAPSKHTVLVFFACDHDLRSQPVSMHAFVRAVDSHLRLNQRLTAAFEAYFDGPTKSEGRQYQAIGPPSTFISATLQGRRAVVDLNLAKAGLTSTTGTQALWLQAHMRALAFQFHPVRALELRFRGSCEDFSTAVQSEGCFVLRRTASSANPSEVPNGIRVAISSHCGVRGVWVNGELWLASPPLGGHNPPRGWDENETLGYFLTTSEERGVFSGDGGQEAHFRLAEPGSADPNDGCE